MVLGLVAHLGELVLAQGAMGMAVPLALTIPQHLILKTLELAQARHQIQTMSKYLHLVRQFQIQCINMQVGRIVSVYGGYPPLILIIW